ncbi:hypothetical protein SETIT_1G329600v2 [Setaria italica]|uniref:Uncharacterized protein n=2 Tax=Setaria TaxID=4554 RepID=A0A368PSJ2_SETIT|nr:hypothetical protein SETIT_1G329600v2 [Setaria italica]TKW41728.1 hypothetical protein SEVIR_1G336400v2 [Setaria viridis]
MSAMEGGHVGTSKMNGACAFNQYRKEEMIPAPQKMNYGEDPSWCRQWQRCIFRVEYGLQTVIALMDFNDMMVNGF